MNKDVYYLKRVVGVALAFFLMSGPAWSGERRSFDEGALHDCVFAGVVKTGYLLANPDATFEDLEGSQVFSGCLAAQGYTRADWSAYRSSADWKTALQARGDERLIEEDEDEAWRAHLRDFDASQTRDSQTRDSQTAYPLLRLERLSPVDGR